MSINPLYVPYSPPPAATAPVATTTVSTGTPSAPVVTTTTTSTTTVSPETASMVVAYHDTQLAIRGTTEVDDQTLMAVQRLETVETLVQKLIVDLVGVPKVYVSQGYTAEKQAADLLAEAQRQGLGPAPVNSPSLPDIPLNAIGSIFVSGRGDDPFL
ncbi:hypothetical protein [Hydrogenophaga sp.]|uniref:hypothetical protein n=1 Tax=Hydrogenophaga sp. TaxID=1904254 RepID=UPI00271C2CB3|nr:hypothetical protein [Hydrogenophaga sp.]MDO9437507.1 hypothetical protein [Hydrogenophaga sp.]